MNLRAWSCWITLMIAGVTWTLWADPPAASTPPSSDLPGALTAFGEVDVLEYDWGWIRWLMSDKLDPDAEMTLGMVHIKPHQTNPLHLHPNSAEYLHVLKGSCEHLVGTTWVTVKAGDTLRIPQDVPHQARTGREGCTAMIVYNTSDQQFVEVDP
jgi:quercetin dioxygenase-like cupin family protein